MEEKMDRRGALSKVVEGKTKHPPADILQQRGRGDKPLTFFSCPMFLMFCLPPSPHLRYALISHSCDAYYSHVLFLRHEARQCEKIKMRSRFMPPYLLAIISSYKFGAKLLQEIRGLYNSQ